MSFLTRTTTTLRSARVTPSITTVAPRLFSTTPAPQKGPIETAKDAVKTVDRAVSNKIVDGIEVGEKATKKVKDATGIYNTSELKGKASEAKNEVKGKASQATGEAKKKTWEAAQKVEDKVGASDNEKPFSNKV
ncbi:hypothetical protein B7463_g908, partial [Scytalidium lignicola]